MAAQIRNKVAYGLSEPLPVVAPAPIVAKRAPTTSDFAPIGQLWIEPVNSSGSAVNSAWILTSIISNSATWQLIESAGGAGVFSSLTVTPGPISLTGTTSINTSGSAVTTIGTGGTGAVNIGNATGNTAVTGSLGTTTTLTAGTGITSTTGNIVASAGNISATLGSLSAGTTVTAGTGITATTGNIVATDGNISATAANRRVTGTGVYASGDAGGVAGTTGLTNLANSAVSTGIMTINSTTANPGANAGYIQMYLGSVAIYVPYFTDIAP